MLSLLVCPFLYQESVQAGIIRKFLCASLAVGAGMEIYVAGEYNKTLSPEKQTRLAKEGHPYLDATLGMVKSTTDTLSPLFANAAKQLENASNTVQLQREEIVPAFIKNHHPFQRKNEIIQDLEKTLKPSVVPLDELKAGGTSASDAPSLTSDTKIHEEQHAQPAPTRSDEIQK